jgi:hypothetical protein
MVASIPWFLISSWMELWFVSDIPKYMTTDENSQIWNSMVQHYQWSGKSLPYSAVLYPYLK